MNVPKSHVLKSLFTRAGVEYPIGYVLDQTGICSVGSLRVQVYRINKALGWTIVIKFGIIKRVK